MRDAWLKWRYRTMPRLMITIANIIDTILALIGFQSVVGHLREQFC